jgi:hypothetical protein
MKENNKKVKGDQKKGQIIPPGTEQETGLTRGKTDKQGLNSKNKKIKGSEELPPSM